MNEIDIIIIVNIIGFLVFIFFVYKWYKLLLKNHGKMIALLLPIALIGFLGAFNGITEKEVKKISESQISKVLDNQKVIEDNSKVKRVTFSKEVSLLQKLHFDYAIELDSLTKDYAIKKEINISNSGATSNLDWTSFNTNLIKVNDSIYDFKINAYYNSKILFILSYSGEKDFTKRVNVKHLD